MNISEKLFTVAELEKIIRAYHAWLCAFGLPDFDGNMQDPEERLADLGTYDPEDEDGEQMPFSAVIDEFFRESSLEDDAETEILMSPFLSVLKPYSEKFKPEITSGIEKAFSKKGANPLWHDKRVEGVMGYLKKKWPTLYFELEKIRTGGNP